MLNSRRVSGCCTELALSLHMSHVACHTRVCATAYGPESSVAWPSEPPTPNTHRSQFDRKSPASTSTPLSCVPRFLCCLSAALSAVTAVRSRFAACPLLSLMSSLFALSSPPAQRLAALGARVTQGVSMKNRRSTNK